MNSTFESLNDPPAGSYPIAVTWEYQPWCDITENGQSDIHKKRSGHVFAVRGNWAELKGLMTVGKHGYLDEIDKPNFKLGCRCHLQWIFNLRTPPTDMLTHEGTTALAVARARIEAMKED